MAHMLAAREIALFQTTGADVHLALATILHDGDTLDVGTELAVDRAERVGDGTSGYGVLAANLTDFGHDRTSIGGALAKVWP